MSTLVMARPGAAVLAGQLCEQLGAEAGTLDLHRFPDGETCPQFSPSPAGREVVLLAPLAQPGERLLALYLAASVARELGARCAGLVTVDPHLHRYHHLSELCIGVHALFAGPATYAALQAAGPARIVTCDTVPHDSNAIGLGAALAAAVRAM